MAKPAAWRLERDSYPFSAATQTRFGDMDVLGHLNNVAFAALFEDGRVRFNRGFELRQYRQEGERWLVAAVEIAYLREGHFPDDVEIASGIGRIGNSSWVIEQAMFQRDQCIATCDTTLVYVDKTRTKAMPDELKQQLAQRRTTGG